MHAQAYAAGVTWNRSDEIDVFVSRTGSRGHKVTSKVLGDKQAARGRRWEERPAMHFHKYLGTWAWKIWQARCYRARQITKYR